jgi:hypothetical protein
MICAKECEGGIQMRRRNVKEIICEGNDLFIMHTLRICDGFVLDCQKQRHVRNVVIHTAKMIAQTFIFFCCKRCLLVE